MKNIFRFNKISFLALSIFALSMPFFSWKGLKAIPQQIIVPEGFSTREFLADTKQSTDQPSLPVAPTPQDSNTNTNNWGRAYGGPGSEVPLTILQSQNGGYLIGAITNSGPTQENQFWVLKVHPNGNVLWETIEPFPDAALWLYDEETNQIKRTRKFPPSASASSIDLSISKPEGFGADANVASWSASLNEENYIFWNRNLDQYGRWIQQRGFNFLDVNIETLDNIRPCCHLSKADYIFEIFAMGKRRPYPVDPCCHKDDDGYLLCRSECVSDYFPLNHYLISRDSGTKLLGEKSDFGWGLGGRCSFLKTDDTGYLGARLGYHLPPDSNNLYLSLIKFDNNLKTLWYKSYYQENLFGEKVLIEYGEAGAYIAAISGGKHELQIVMIGPTGEIIWRQAYGGIAENEANQISKTSDGGYVVIGSTRPPNKNNQDILIMKIDATGNLVWRKTYGDAGEDIGYKIISTKDGGYLVAASTTSLGAGQEDILLLKLDAEGRLYQSGTPGSVALIPGGPPKEREGFDIITPEKCDWSGSLKEVNNNNEFYSKIIFTSTKLKANKPAGFIDISGRCQASLILQGMIMGANSARYLFLINDPLMNENTPNSQDDCYNNYSLILSLGDDLKKLDLTIKNKDNVETAKGSYKFNCKVY